MNLKIFSLFLLQIIVINALNDQITAINLQNKIYNSNENTFLHEFKPNEITTLFATSSKLYSTQLSEKLINQHFSIINNTKLYLNANSSRMQICSDLMTFQKDTFLEKRHSICSFNLNFVLYLGNANFVNQIKSIKINLIISDLSKDHLSFNRDFNEFNVDINELIENLNEDMIIIGELKASLRIDKDLNQLVKYFIDLKDEDKSKYAQLVHIDNGLLKINKTIIQSLNTLTRFEFHVDAIVQCSSTQKPIRNRTMVILNLIHKTHMRFSYRSTNLTETKIISSNTECLLLKEKDLISNSMIALTQIIIDQSHDTQSLDHFKLISLKQYRSPKDLNNSNIKIEHLIDNIYVVYLVLNSWFEQIYLTNIYKVKLGLNNMSLIEFYICINSLDSMRFDEEFSLIQFDQDVYNINQPVKLNSHLNKQESNRVLIGASDLTEKHQKINFYFLNSPVKFKIEDVIGSEQVIVNFIKTNNEISKVEKLQHEVKAIASAKDFNETIEAYERLNDLAITYKKQLRFESKIKINTQHEILIDDDSILSEAENVYNFYIRTENLVKNSVVGYLPNIYDIKFDYQTQTEDLFYVIDENNKNAKSCFQLNKFDGILSLVSDEVNYFMNKTKIELGIFIQSRNDQKLNIKFANVVINFIPNELTSNLGVNLIYDSYIKNINETFKSLINANLQLSLDNKTRTLPTFIRLINLVSRSNTKFEFLEKDSPVFLLDTKRNSIYLNSSSINQIESKCYILELIAKNYEYLNSIERKLTSLEEVKINICLKILWDSNSNHFVETLVEQLTDFQYLIKNTTENFHYLFVISLVLIILILALIFLNVYLRNTKNAKNEHSLKVKSVNQSSQDAALLYQFNSTPERVFTSSSELTTSTNTLTQSTTLQIRNDLSLKRNVNIKVSYLFYMFISRCFK